MKLQELYAFKPGSINLNIWTDPRPRTPRTDLTYLWSQNQIKLQETSVVLLLGFHLWPVKTISTCKQKEETLWENDTGI